MSSVDYPRERDATAIDVGGGDHGPSALAGEEVRRQRFDDTRHKLRELFERWNDRLVLKEVSLIEAYIQGRISIGLNVEVSGAAFGDCAAIGKDAELVLWKETRAVLVYDVQAAPPRERRRTRPGLSSTGRRACYDLVERPRIRQRGFARVSPGSLAPKSAPLQIAQLDNRAFR